MSGDVRGNDWQPHRQRLGDTEVVTLPLGQADVEVARSVEFGHFLVGDIGEYDDAELTQVRHVLFIASPSQDECRAVGQGGDHVRNFGC